MPHSTPLVNHSLEISADEIEQLWDAGTPTADALNLLPAQSYVQSKRSENGEWHLKFDPLHDEDYFHTDLTPEERCDIHDKELARLRRLGLHVITFARVPFNEARKVMTLTPWVEGIKEATPDQRDTYITPVVRKYYQGWLRAQKYKITRNRRPYYALDLSVEQHSTVEGRERPFLHDLDPALNNNEAALRVKLG
jgi:hypothetical protein